MSCCHISHSDLTFRDIVGVGQGLGSRSEWQEALELDHPAEFGKVEHGILDGLAFGSDLFLDVDLEQRVARGVFEKNVCEIPRHRYVSIQVDRR